MTLEEFDTVVAWILEATDDEDWFEELSGTRRSLVNDALQHTRERKFSEEIQRKEEQALLVRLIQKHGVPQQFVGGAP